MTRADKGSPTCIGNSLILGRRKEATLQTITACKSVRWLLRYNQGCFYRKSWEGAYNLGRSWVMTHIPSQFLRRRLHRYVNEYEETRQETVPPRLPNTYIGPTDHPIGIGSNPSHFPAWPWFEQKPGHFQSSWFSYFSWISLLENICRIKRIQTQDFTTAYTNPVVSTKLMGQFYGM